MTFSGCEPWSSDLGAARATATQSRIMGIAINPSRVTPTRRCFRFLAFWSALNQNGNGFLDSTIFVQNETNSKMAEILVNPRFTQKIANSGEVCIESVWIRSVIVGGRTQTAVIYAHQLPEYEQPASIQDGIGNPTTTGSVVYVASLKTTEETQKGTIQG